MIYLDTSVVLAHLLAEDHRASPSFWEGDLVSSRLIEYETWTRIHAFGLAQSIGEAARALIGRLSLVEMRSTVLARALEPFPVPVRTLDAIHLATLEHLKGRQIDVSLASFDRRQVAAARRLGISIAPL